MRNIWICHGNIQHLRMSGGIGAYLFQRFVLLLVNVFTICLGKGFALAKVHLYDISNDILKVLVIGLGAGSIKTIATYCIRVCYRSLRRANQN